MIPSAPAPAGIADAAAAFAAAVAAAAAAGDRPIDRSEVESIIDQRIESLRDTLGVRRYVVSVPNRPDVDCGVQHRDFPKILDLLLDGDSLYLYGPAGTGKTQMPIEAAKALGVEYALISLNPATPASKLEGFIDAQGRFTAPDFHRLYSQGGIFIIDEADNMAASLATTLNSAIANRVASFPCGMVQMSPEFRLVCTANTPGRGPTALHPERRKLDTATLDRLWLEEILPDPALELSLALAHAGGKDSQAKAWCEWIQSMREYTARPDCGVTGAVYTSMRQIIAGAKKIANPPAWLTVNHLAESTVRKGLPPDQWGRLIAAVPLPLGVL